MPRPAADFWVDVFGQVWCGPATPALVWTFAPVADEERRGRGPIALERVEHMAAEGARAMKPCDRDSRPLYENLIGPLRERAHELGYALCVHGTLKRDIDLVAVPRTAEAVDARTLAEAIQAVAAEHNGGLAFRKPQEDNGYFWAGCPGAKPHGRLVWSIHLNGGPYIDPSVMPRTDPAKPSIEELIEARQEAEARGPMKNYVRGQEIG